MKKFILIFLLIFGLTPQASFAAPTLETARREVDRLRTIAAEKFEAANEATIRIRELEQETASLEEQESVLQKDLTASSANLARLAISQYKSNGFGETFGLLFSSDPTRYLSDAGTLDLIARTYSKQQREFATTKLKVEASQFVISDRTALLKAERIRLNREVEQAKSSITKAEKILKSLKKEDRERLAREEADRENKILNESKKYAKSFKGDNSRGSIALRYALEQVGDVYVWAAAGQLVGIVQGSPCALSKRPVSPCHTLPVFKSDMENQSRTAQLSPVISSSSVAPSATFQSIWAAARWSTRQGQESALR